VLPLAWNWITDTLYSFEYPITIIYHMSHCL
jgi:hypothetical protein